jgi:hypothetical protein
VFLAVLSIGAIAAVVITQEPTRAGAVSVVAAAAVAASAIGALVLLRYAGVGRSARARASRVRALRRGVEIGAVVGLLATLRIIDGLTPLTALFVVLSFAVAEYVLSAGVSRSA